MQQSASKGVPTKIRDVENHKLHECGLLISRGTKSKRSDDKNCCQLREIFEVDEALHSSEANEAPLMSNLTHLELESMAKLRCIWNEPYLSVINLQSLKIVKISNCKGLRFLFSPSLVKSLVHLEKLILHDLPELQQLITERESDVDKEQQVLKTVKEKDKASASASQGHLQPICFPSLIEIRVENCNNLKSLISTSVALSLSQLQRLTISGASKLEQVFEYEGGINIEDTGREIVLPQLRMLHLQELPKLEGFTLMGYHCCFIQLDSLTVKECPNLTTSFSVDSKETIHARTKAVGDAPMEGSAAVSYSQESSWPIGSDINWTVW
ncbi:hypothetical protein PTKIN_Ptkin11bG0177400 [Pterospermum kingtungense]